MPETQREKVPRNDGGELDTATAFLAFARHCLIKKTQGLDDEQLRRVLVDSGTSLLGLIQHSVVGERWWFGYHLLGVGEEDDFDFTMTVPPERNAADIVQDYRNAIDESDATIRRIGDPEALTARPIDDRPLSLRWVLAHMTSETARHAGHADIIREQIDDVTGR
ncbi:MAG TPA: DinB family protein [Acidothermaceae bacterium]